MSLRSVLKERVEHLPPTLGRSLTFVPFSLRLGSVYGQSVKAIYKAEIENWTQRSAQQLAALKSVLRTAVKEVEFYREFYRSKGFVPEEVQSWSDWAQVPLVTKSDMQAVPLDARCARGSHGMHINTGGTSGQPLEFLLDDHAFAREWAHMHFIWKGRGYRPRQIKLTFRGKHFDRAEPLRYNAVHNEFVANANCTMSHVLNAVLALPRNRVIRWVHGYPSLVAEFAHAIEEHGCSETMPFRSRLFGVLLGSEYPAQTYRTVIERVLSTNVVSWYGHSEMAILARETAHGVYESMPTYGHAEAVSVEHGLGHRLVCTSLHNGVHPFIRYDTGDLIEPVYENEGVLAFRISDGRVGDFVMDRKGNRLALTSIIFGRHHAAFRLLQHLQVRDEGAGSIALVVTPRKSDQPMEELKNGFDLNDLDISWRIEVVNAPIRTSAGKIRLKI